MLTLHKIGRMIYKSQQLRFRCLTFLYKILRFFVFFCCFLAPFFHKIVKTEILTAKENQHLEILRILSNSAKVFSGQQLQSLGVLPSAV